MRAVPTGTRQEATMRMLRIPAVAALVALGLIAAGGAPASADPVPAASATVGASATAVTVPGSSDDEAPESDAKRKPKWKGSVTWDLDSGLYRAQLTDKRSGNSYVVGSYQTEREAQEAADRAAESRNNGGSGFVPGCQPPAVC
jgi:hypothetical protein